MNLYSLDFTELLVHLLRERLATYLQHHLQPDQQISVKVLFLPPQSLSNFCMGNFSGDLTRGASLADQERQGHAHVGPERGGEGGHHSQRFDYYMYTHKYV